MISIFTKRLPRSIQRDIYLEYLRRKDQLARILRNSDSYRWLKKDSEVTELILACSVFYFHVLGQMADASRSIRSMSYRNIDAIQMGSYRLTIDEAGKFDRITKQFMAIMGEYGVPIRLLDMSDMYRYAKQLNDALKEKNDGKPIQR